MIYQFGRKEPKDRGYEQKYPIRMLLGAAQVKSVERVLPFSAALQTFYDQKQYQACVGFSTSIMMSLYNARQKYDALWLYHQAQANDDDPTTDPSVDAGAYVWAAFKTLQKIGHKNVREKAPDMKDGILSYYWATSTDEARAAIAIGRPVVIGVNWYEEFMAPKLIGGEHWIGMSHDIGNSLGGHAICLNGASDKRDAFKLAPSWGMGYPSVWLPYAIFDRLMREGGEACVGVDNPEVT